MKISDIIVVIMTGGGILLSTPPPQLKLQVAVPLGYRLASAQRNQSPLHWARRVAMRQEWESGVGKTTAFNAFGVRSKVWLWV